MPCVRTVLRCRARWKPRTEMPFSVAEAHGTEEEPRGNGYPRPHSQHGFAERQSRTHPARRRCTRTRGRRWRRSPPRTRRIRSRRARLRSAAAGYPRDTSSPQGGARTATYRGSLSSMCNFPRKCLYLQRSTDSPGQLCRASGSLRTSVDPAMKWSKATDRSPWRGRGQAWERTGELEGGQELLLLRVAHREALVHLDG